MSTKISVKLIGVGGCGCSSVRRLMHDHEPIEDFSVLAANTDGQNLETSFPEDDEKIKLWREKNLFDALLLGGEGVKGVGGGGNPEVGRRLTEASTEQIRAFVQGADVVMVTCGLGKATGGGGAHVVARIAREVCENVVVVATLPFLAEGKIRRTKAAEAAEKLREFPSIFVKNEALNGVLGSEDIVWNDALDQINRVVVVPLVMNLRDVAQVHGDVTNTDVADLGQVLKRGTDGWFNTCRFDEGLVREALVNEAQERLLKNTFLDRRVLRHATGLSVWFRGTWKFRETQAILELFGSGDAEGERFWGHVQTDEPRRVSVLAMADLSGLAEDEEPGPQIVLAGEGSLQPKALRCRVAGRDGRPVGPQVTLFFPGVWVDAWNQEVAKATPDLEVLRGLQRQMAAADPQGRAPALPARLLG